MRVITAITNSNPATVTTSVNHFYTDGSIVRLVIPQICGMPQANNLTGVTTSTGAQTFTIDIDTTNFDPFSIPIAPSPHDNICALVIPIGEANDTLAAATQNVLPY